VRFSDIRGEGLQYLDLRIGYGKHVDWWLTSGAHLEGSRDDPETLDARRLHVSPHFRLRQ
jgi:hypothetical protein